MRTVRRVGAARLAGDRRPMRWHRIGGTDTSPTLIGVPLGDYPPAYASWASSVKQLGGVVTTWPASLAPTANATKPAARFTTAKYVELFNTRKIDTTLSQSADKTGNVYVLAPASVLSIRNLEAQLSAAGSPNNPQEAALYQESLWQKLGLPDLSGPAKTIALVAALGAGVVVAAKLLPRGRHRAAAV